MMDVFDAADERNIEPQQPTICRAIHYVAHGSRDGTYPPTCRSATVTEVPDLLPEAGPNSGPPGYVRSVMAAVLNPTGLFFTPKPLDYDPSATEPATWHWPQACPHGL